MPVVKSTAAPLVCPLCHGELEKEAQAVACGRCDERYPREDGIVDFSRGRYYDDFTGPASLSEANLAGLEHEVSGTIARVRDFYAPLILEQRRDDRRPLRVLDSGCGNGISVEYLTERGMEAWGNDISRLRRWQWRERASTDRLVVADTRGLPFPESYFDCVISSGVIEHVGVAEVGYPRYSVRPLPSRDAERIEFLHELLRVTAEDGTLYLDFPNGAFPIDFWHGDSPGGARFHTLREGFLPTVREVRRYVAEIGSYAVLPLSPYGRLQMKQVGTHWFGRLFKTPMSLLLRSMTYLQPLAGTFVNPYLVLAIKRRSPGTLGAH